MSETTRASTSTSTPLGRAGALGTMAGILLSGPIAVALVEAVAPQPPWSGPEAFVAAWSPWQVVPYVAGFVLVGSLVALMVGAWVVAPPRHRPRATLALVLTGVFATMIVINYTLQVALVPSLVAGARASHGVLVEVFSMGNPTSLAWALEMIGYGVLGVATWIAAPVMADLGLRWAARAFVANGVMSVAGAVWTALDPGWEPTTAGLVAFALWNVVLFAMAWLALAAFAGAPRPARVGSAA